MNQKGGIFIEEKEKKFEKLKELIQSEEKEKLKEILNNVLHLGIEDIKYDKEISLSNISEYEFNLLKVRAILTTEDDVEMYLKLIKNSKVKESIFCYWCSIYEEELLKTEESEEIDVFLNKVLISELTKKKYQQSVFLEIENNKTSILETGTEVNFIEVANYINEYQNKKNNFSELFKYFDKESDDVLLVGIKMKKGKTGQDN